MSLPELPYITPSAVACFMRESYSGRFQYHENSPVATKNVIHDLIRRSKYQPKNNIGREEINKYLLTGSNDRFLMKIELKPQEFNLVYYLHRFFFTAHVSNGVMGVETILLNKGCRHYYFPHYQEIFIDSFRRFSRQGYPVACYKAEWPKYMGDEELLIYSTNHQLYTQAVSGGMKPEAAAFQTPDGKVVKKLGYKKFELDSYGDPYSNNVVVGYFSK